MSAVIPPGKGAWVTARPHQMFRPERITISPNSFPVPLPRQIWTWPLVALGSALTRVHRKLVRVLRVDPHAVHERHEPVDDAYVGDDAIEKYDNDYDELRRYRVVPIPFTFRERMLGPLGRAAAWLAGIRLRWQQHHLGFLTITNVMINARPALNEDAKLSADLFAAPAIDSFVSFEPCKAGRDITITIENGSRRECRLSMAIFGTTVE